MNSMPILHIDHFPQEFRKAVNFAYKSAEDSYISRYAGDFEELYSHYWKLNLPERDIDEESFHAHLPLGAEEEPLEIFGRFLVTLVCRIQIAIRDSETRGLNERWEHLLNAYECIGHLKRIMHYEFLEERYAEIRERTAKAASTRHGARVRNIKAKVIELLQEHSTDGQWKNIKDALATISTPLEKFINNQPTIYNNGVPQIRSLEATLKDIYQWRNRDEDFKTSFNQFLFNKRKRKLPLAKARKARITL